MPEIERFRYRGINFTSWNTDFNFSKKYINTPIYIYSFHQENKKLDSFKYLENVPEQDKMKLYKLGTVSHEIAHHIYDYAMDAKKKKEWQDLSDKLLKQGKSITDYANEYSGKDLMYDEIFSEAVKIKTINPDYLKENFPEMNDFLNNNLLEINKQAA